MRSFKLVEFGRSLVCVDATPPTPVGEEVLVRIGSCGVCHSDLHVQDGFFDFGSGQRFDISRGVAPPRTLGHEIAGEVVAVGPDAGAAEIGDRVVVFPWIGCGNCSLCRAGLEHLCNRQLTLGITRDGGYSDHVLVPHARYLVPYGDLGEEQACTYACSGLTAFSAIRKAEPLRPDDTVLVIGAGGVGLSGIRLLQKIWGVRPIVAEPDRRKWAVAEEAGAAKMVDPKDPTIAGELVKLTKGGVAVVFDFVGAGETLAFGISTVRKGGRLIVVGMMGGSTPVAPALLALKAVSVVGSCVGSLAELQQLMQVARDGGLPALHVTRRPLDDANEALDELRAGKVVGRVVLIPSGERADAGS